MRKTGGAFDPAAHHLYFIAAGGSEMATGATLHDHLLIAVNEVRAGEETALAGWLDAGKTVFLDSGIYNLAVGHAKARGISMDAALSLPPDGLDGFPELFDRYTAIVAKYGDRLWGYIELDQGGRENKVKTRARLESLGLAPIPVYHPLNDGWAYFDELATRYDRICVGNIVQADVMTRKRIVATIWQRKVERYPHLWVHLLGHSPNQYLHAYPLNSGDSSSWLAGIRWQPGQTEKANGATITAMPVNFRYQLGADPVALNGKHQAVRIAAQVTNAVERNWLDYLATVEAR